MKLILASNSRERKNILDNVNFKYEVKPSNIEEHSKETNPCLYCMDLSKQKARAVSESTPEGIILAADSIIYIDDLKLEKPKSKEQAKEMLKILSSRKNVAVTGVTIIDKYQDREVTFNVETEVYFDELTDDLIDWYIENETFIFERAGYSISGKSSLYISSINGDYYNVLGLPISRVYKELKNLRYEIKDFT